MQYKTPVACASAVILALAVACSKTPQTPVAPTSADPGVTEAAADGSTLKVTAPTTQSPINNAQPDGTVVLTIGRATGKFSSNLAATLTYEFEILNSGNQRVYFGTQAGGTAEAISHTVTGSLEFDQPHTWRSRAIRASASGTGVAVGPWSSNASFRSPAGGYIRGNELFDPLTNGRTIGHRVGGTQFVQGQGIELFAHDSRVSYELPENLQSGEVSVMVTGIDEGSPGDKTKVFSMQEGGGDITTNDYRVTVEKRGRIYPIPGATQFRIIMGDSREEFHRIFDSARIPLSLSDERWYFWKFTWQSPGRATLEVREDGPKGGVIYNNSRGTGGFLYRPVPHVIHLGAPVGRGGPQDASIPGAIYKNLWVSGRPRPVLPGE